MHKSDLCAQDDPLRGNVPQSFWMMARAGPLLIVLLFSKECGYGATRPESAPFVLIVRFCLGNKWIANFTILASTQREYFGEQERCLRVQ
ncbi:MAG TPA: hypothetical protein VJ255_15180, partial [Candidatus Acidoferrum sp.]|nr:hypothetical protein [Candidatus Acidoferrum sp.]